LRTIDIKLISLKVSYANKKRVKAFSKRRQEPKGAEKRKKK